MGLFLDVGNDWFGDEYPVLEVWWGKGKASFKGNITKDGFLVRGW